MFKFDFGGSAAGATAATPACEPAAALYLAEARELAPDELTNKVQSR